MWNRLRESERLQAVESARVYANRGQCQRALGALDRAQARWELGDFGREANELRFRCYEDLGLNQVAQAHRRMIEDFFDQPGSGDPTAQGQVRVGGGADRDLVAMPPTFAIGQPRYTESARRSNLVGRVVVSFEVDAKYQARAIRVLEMPHPLLASWAIEAVARLKRNPDADSALSSPGMRYVTAFNFWHRWAEPENTHPGST